MVSSARLALAPAFSVGLPGIVLRNVGTITSELSPKFDRRATTPWHFFCMLPFRGPGWILGFLKTGVCANLVRQEFRGRLIVALSSTSWTQQPHFEYELVWNMPFLSIR